MIDGHKAIANQVVTNAAVEGSKHFHELALAFQAAEPGFALAAYFGISIWAGIVQTCKERFNARASFFGDRLEASIGLEPPPDVIPALDLVLQIQDVVQRAVNEPFEEKYQAYCLALTGTVSSWEKPPTEFYYRMKAWIAALDTDVLLLLSKLETSSRSYLEKNYLQPMEGVVDPYQVHAIAIPIDDLKIQIEKLGSTVRVEKLVMQLTGCGLAFFDRGGGAGDPFLANSKLIIDARVGAFATKLRGGAFDGPSGRTDASSV